VKFARVDSFPNLETPVYDGNDHLLSVQDTKCEDHNERSLHSTKEYKKWIVKSDLATLSKDQLCRTLREIARQSNHHPLDIDMTHVKRQYDDPTPSRTMPINAIIRGTSIGDIICDNTKKPFKSGNVVLVGPYANGPHGLCDDRSKLLEIVKANVITGPDQVQYSKLGESIPYWFLLEDTVKFSDYRYSAFGVREKMRLADGSIVATIEPLGNAKTLANFVTDSGRLLTPVSEITKNPNANLREGPSFEPFELDPRGHEGKICYNHVSHISHEDWVNTPSDTDVDMVAFYPELQRLPTDSKGILKAHCYIRSEILRQVENFHTENSSKSGGARDNVVYKLPYPPHYFITEESFKMLSDSTIHSFALRFIEKTTIGGGYVAHGEIFSLKPIRSESDVSRLLISTESRSI
jgi:hypothetical protein